MYEAYFGLADQPFHIAPDLRFHVDTASQRAAITTVMHGLDRGDEFMLLEGDFGAGKTTAGRWLLAHLDPARYTVGELSGMRLEGDPLLKRIADAFGLDDFDIVRPLGTLVQFFESFARSGREAVLMIDEAHCLGVDALRRLRKLTAVTVAGHRALHVLLVGRGAPVEGLAELDRIGRPLRLGARTSLGPLDALSTNAYVLSRLHRAGWNGHPSLEPGATAAIHACTEGNPGRINRLCGHVLLQLYMHSRDVITVDLVQRVDEQLKAEWEGDTELSALPPLPAAPVAAVAAPAPAPMPMPTAEPADVVQVSPAPAPAAEALPAPPLPVVAPRPAVGAAVLEFAPLVRLPAVPTLPAVRSSPSLALVATTDHRRPSPWSEEGIRRRRLIQAAAAVVIVVGAGALWKGLGTAIGGTAPAPASMATAAPAVPVAPTASTALTAATLADAAAATLAQAPTAAHPAAAAATPPASNAAPDAVPAALHPAEPAHTATATALDPTRRHVRARPAAARSAQATTPGCTLEAQAMGLCRHGATLQDAPLDVPDEGIRETRTIVPAPTTAQAAAPASPHAACDASRTALGLCAD